MVQNSIIQAANSPYSLSEIQKSVSSTALLFHTWSLGNFPLSAHPKAIFFSMLLKYCMRLTQPQDTYMLFTLWYNVFYLWSEESARTKDINILVPKIYWCWSSQWNTIPLLMPFSLTSVFIYIFSYISPRAWAKTDRAQLQTEISLFKRPFWYNWAKDRLKTHIMLR